MVFLSDLIAAITPYSSITGTGVTLMTKDGKPFALVSLIGTTPDKEYKDWAPIIAGELASLINANTETN